MQLRQAPIVLVAAALATSVHAEPETAQVAAPQEPVAVEVNVCLGSEQEGEVDPECRAMQSQLIQMRVRLGTLKVQKKQTVAVRFGELTGVSLPTGSTVEFRPISIVDNKLHMQLEMPGVVNTRLRLQSGRSVILAGERHADGYVIIELKPTFAPPPPDAPIIVRRPTPTPEAEKAGSRTTR